MEGGHPEIDLAHIHWSSPEIIYSLPTKSLSTPDEALDYFAFSPFWDVRSNNQVLRIQRMVTGIPYGHAQEKIDLLNFRAGFEFVIAHSQPPNLFVVHKRNVGPGSKGERGAGVIGQWFILEGKIYPCPTVYDVIATRLKNASFLVSSTFSTLQAEHPASNPRTHSSWRAMLPPIAPNSEVLTDKATEDPNALKGAAKPKETTPAASDFALSQALESTRQSLKEIEEMALAPATRLGPADELKRIEEEILGSAGGSGADGRGADGARSIRSASVLPVLRGQGGLGTPSTRFLGPRTPGMSVASPLSFQS